MSRGLLERQEPRAHEDLEKHVVKVSGHACFGRRRCEIPKGDPKVIKDSQTKTPKEDFKIIKGDTMVPKGDIHQVKDSQDCATNVASLAIRPRIALQVSMRWINNLCLT